MFEYNHTLNDRNEACGCTKELFIKFREFVTREIIENEGKQSELIQRLENRVSENPIFVRMILMIMYDMYRMADHLMSDVEAKIGVVSKEFMLSKKDEIISRLTSGESKEKICEDLALEYISKTENIDPDKIKVHSMKDTKDGIVVTVNKES